MRTQLFVVAVGVIGACGNGNQAVADAEYSGWQMETLTNDQGFSYRIPPFEVDPGKEVQNCYFVKVPDINHGQPVWIDHFKMAQNPGSHHLNIFRVKTIINLGPDIASATPTDLGYGSVSYPATVVQGAEEYATNPCWLSANWADWPLVANDQGGSVSDAFYDWQLPDNVATKLMPGEMLMVQSHYVNSGDQKTIGGAQIGINFYSHNPTTTPITLGTLFATQQHIRVCQSTPAVSYSGTCKLPTGTMTITAANGHFHRRGKEFDIYTWDGQTATQPPAAAMFYKDSNWNEPPMATNIGATINGGGIYWTCSYQWSPPQYSTCDEVNAKDPLKQNDCCYTFGGDTDIGEHCNVFVYFYPGDGGDVFCN